VVSSRFGLLDRIAENARFPIDSLTTVVLATGSAPFPRHDPRSFVDARIVANMQGEGPGYPYAFDDDRDGIGDIYRPETATNPYDPN